VGTYFPNPKEISAQWYLVDAKGQSLGRLASKVASILMGKNDPRYTPFMDLGNHVIVVNAQEVSLSGSKATQKCYQHYTGYPGGLRDRTFADLMEKRPEEVVRLAIERMLPKNKLGKSLKRKLRVYRHHDHPHQAQTPAKIEIPRKLGPRVQTEDRREIRKAFSIWVKKLTPAERNRVVIRRFSKSFTPAQIQEEIRRGTPVGQEILRSLYRLNAFDADRSLKDTAA
jgi:large subunit ribosomal protein L13